MKMKKNKIIVSRHLMQGNMMLLFGVFIFSGINQCLGFMLIIILRTCMFGWILS